MQGPARVGKTSVKCLVLSQPYDKNNSTSTGVAERPQVAVATEHLQEAVGDFSMQTYGQNEEKNGYWSVTKTLLKCLQMISSLY